MFPFLTNQDGTLPDLLTLKGDAVGGFAKNAVDRASRAILVKFPAGAAGGSVALVDASGTPYSATNPVPVDTEGAASAAYTDGSGTIAAGGVSQQIFAAAATRVYLFILNLSDTDMWINFGTAAVATQPSIRLAPNGGYFEPSVAPNQSIHIFCATTGKAFVAKSA